MSVLIKSGKLYYEIPMEILEKCKITKKQFEKSSKKLSADVAGQCNDCSLVVFGKPCDTGTVTLFTACKK